MSMLTIIFALVAASLFIGIGYILAKTEKKNLNTIAQLINLFKFIIKTEFLSPPGKVNFGMGVLVTIFSLVLAFPLLFMALYQLIFGTQILDSKIFNYISNYFIWCALPLSFIEALIYWKIPKNGQGK